MLDITATIVLYKNDLDILKAAVNSFLGSELKKKLFLVDNSPTDDLRVYFEDNPDIEYIYSNDNLGFGKGHNKVIDFIKNKSRFHLVLNPDVEFNPDQLLILLNRVVKEDKIGIIAPKIFYPDGKMQFSCRRFPSFKELIIRKFNFLRNFFPKIVSYGQYQDRNLELEMEVDYLSGCFQLFRTEVFIQIGGFDERYFMYMEDIDICKKVINAGYVNLYYPKAYILHVFEKGSSKKLKLLKEHIISVFKYYMKWN